MSIEPSALSLQDASTSESSTPGSQSLNYTIIAQNAEELRDIQNAPAVSMARFLTDHEQMAIVPTISIYAERGSDRTQARLLYMNTVALQIWKEMGRKPTEIGTTHRPTRTAVLVFGMPFSE